MINCEIGITKQQLPWSFYDRIFLEKVYVIYNFERFVIDLSDAGWSIAGGPASKGMPCIANPMAAQLSTHSNRDIAYVGDLISRGFIVVFI